VLGFGSSSNLAGAYGIAVTGTMAIDSILIFVVMRNLWHWPTAACAAVSSFFLSIDLCYFSANLVKLLVGGWFPVVVGILVYVLLSTGRSCGSCSSLRPAPSR
jgi:KUP system potassium uptake protein